MKVFVIIGHQKVGSFCHAIADVAVNELGKLGHEVVFHDLYREKFDPILTHEELAGDAPIDPTVKQHLEEITAAEAYVVVHPNWWGQPPAMLKGWIDRVFRQGYCYEFGPQGPIGMLSGRKRASAGML